MSEADAEAYYREHGWSGCPGSSWDRLTEATRDGWREAARIAAKAKETTDDHLPLGR